MVEIGGVHRLLRVGRRTPSVDVGPEDTVRPEAPTPGRTELSLPRG
jgi:hypothetical protein